MSDTNALEYRAPADDAELTALGTLLSHALHFNMTPEQVRDWLDRCGPEGFRLVTRGGVMAAGLRFIACGQWYGGARVPVAAITPVGCAAEHRGFGVASRMMQRMHEEVRQRGLPLSVLFPATITFYRRTGYERAGAWNTYECPTTVLSGRSRALEVVPVPEGDAEGEAEIRRAYERRARQTNGHLDRWPMLWQRVLEPRGKQGQRFLIRREAQTEGYVCFYRQGQNEPIRITDVCVLSREAGERLLTFFADHRSLASAIIWNGGANDPLLYLLPEHGVKATGIEDWVLRVTDVEQALRLRGYPLGLRAELHLDVRDEQLPWNHGRFVLRVEEGRAEVARASARSEGGLALDARTLSPLYTGHLTARELAVVGRLDGPGRDIATADLVFSGSRPWMPDIF